MTKSNKETTKKASNSKASTQSQSAKKTDIISSDGKSKHPKQNIVKVIMNNGEEFEMLTTWNGGDVFRPDLDPTNHPAWQKGNAQNFVNNNDNRIKDFKNKYGDFI